VITRRKRHCYYFDNRDQHITTNTLYFMFMFCCHTATGKGSSVWKASTSNTTKNVLKIVYGPVKPGTTSQKLISQTILKIVHHHVINNQTVMAVEWCFDTGVDCRGPDHCYNGCRMSIQVLLHQQWWDADMAIKWRCETSMDWCWPVHRDNRSSMSTKVQWRT